MSNPFGTQNDLILRMLRDYGTHGITPMDALKDAGCMRLASRIFDLKRLGHDIIDQTVEVEGRYGKVRVKRYWLVQPKPIVPEVKPTPSPVVQQALDL